MKRILVIDDDLRVQESIRITLETMTDWDVVLASSGREGIAIAHAQQPDAILLDLMMPDWDGLMTFKQLRANSATAALPVVLMTAMSYPDEEHQFIQLGIKAVFTKPFDPIILADRIADVLNW